MNTLRNRAERALVRARALGVTDSRGQPLGIEQMLELVAAEEGECASPGGQCMPDAPLPGFMREIASTRARMKDWPRWMTQAAVVAGATLPGRTR